MTTQRGGFTFIEMMLVLILGLTLMAGAYGVLIEQDEAYGTLRARAATQQDARMGIDLLTAELREISTVGGDLAMADDDAIRFRALRKYGIVCQTDKNNKRIVVAQRGMDPFAADDSIAVYVDQDSLQAADDVWQQDLIDGVSSPAVCLTSLGAMIATVLPGYDLTQLQINGAGLRYDSIYPGAPIRSYEVLTYRTATSDGRTMLVRQDVDGVVPLLGPLTDTDGLVFRYYDAMGTELTGVPLSATDRESVRRIQIVLRTERQSGSQSGERTEELVTDVHLRGSV